MTVLLGGPMFLLVVHAAVVANWTHTFDWRYDAAGRQAMQAVAAWVASHPSPAPLRLRVDWMLEPSGTFYRTRFGLETVLARLDRSGIDGDADLVFVHAHQAKTIEARGGARLFASNLASTVLYALPPRPGEPAPSVTQGR